MWRLFLAMPIAISMTVGLFTFMAWMVDNGVQGKPESSETIRFDMVIAEQEQDVQRRQRRVPEKPESPEPPPQATPMAVQTQTSMATQQSSMPLIGLDSSISGLAISAPNFSDFKGNQQAMPLYRVEPRYPSKAMKRGAEGFVVMSFTIDEQGRPTDVKVTDAKPRRMFEREAVKALKKWKYQPKVLDGKAISQVGQTVKLEFTLAK
ncbi:energy transducer TonB [Aliivibrio sp. S4TY2]|uniref:energy transducer TonB n=1 Tax=unclassified Aliivibrio TaxID=2645654 RepID=UPI002379C4E7|nr:MULTISPECIES: energy transducer TonB [unclassified Aliivibrio]MDD9155370.1 energy transducer TonB [Aliivibrio sp. S4TY2]MDD9159078.1 energy transducer TonB [Aliivibrio sp. S4TY1]MDD9163372.1 energy transducer TonB [Aliivibrio sp. S4MY2]MDD9167077.1 energy transducer TonB [Aliivibrio sp. S4MY4]MDD9184449.1 energy transducer TonB [Aliivibrio sp. S4MY3]